MQLHAECAKVTGHHRSHRNGIRRDNHEAADNRPEDKDEGLYEGI